MPNETKNENQLSRIESQLFQIKLLLIIIADLCIGGFYGLSRMSHDDIGGIMTQICEVFIVIGLIATVVFPIIWLTSLSTRSRRSTTEPDPKRVDGA